MYTTIEEKLNDDENVYFAGSKFLVKSMIKHFQKVMLFAIHVMSILETVIRGIKILEVNLLTVNPPIL